MKKMHLENYTHFYTLNGPKTCKINKNAVAFNTENIECKISNYKIRFEI